MSRKIKNKQDLRMDFYEVLDKHPRYTVSPIIYHPEGYVFAYIMTKNDRKKIGKIIWKFND